MDLAIIQQCTPPNVSLHTMQHVASVESGRSAHAIGFNVFRRVSIPGTDKTRRETFVLKTKPKDRDEAIVWAKYLTSQGYEFDAGYSQVHSTNFARHGLTVETVFDACPNIRAGALILTDCYTRARKIYPTDEDALKAALSCYSSGDFATGFATGYVQKFVTPGIKIGQPSRPGPVADIIRKDAHVTMENVSLAR
jgi:type IV secretion system protein VirB1